MSVTTITQHRVADYEAWRVVYDGFASVQDAAGVTHKSVHRSVDDPNNVLVVHCFATVEEADAFMNGSEIREAMQKAGVEGPPRIEVYEDA
jgi:hypothetical protein